MPTRSVLVDASFIAVLVAIASQGFRDTFTGWQYFVASMTGLVLGILVAHIANALRQPVIVLAVFTVAAFFLLGGAVAVHGAESTSVLPLPDTVVLLAEQGVFGWKELLTTLPPVADGPLLVLPYILGLVCGAAAMALAGRFTSPAVPALAPVLFLAAVILLGVLDPRDTAVLGGCFAAVLLAWIAVRGRRLHTRASSRGPGVVRVVLALGLVAVTGLVATVVGPGLPGTGDRQRVVLRTYMEPPFDVGQYPSPLASFRRYTKGYKAPESRKLYKSPLFSISGAPEGTLVRIATLDSYNGVVWAAANDSGTETGINDTFQKVGTVIPQEATGNEVDGSITVLEGFDGVWVPTVGAMTTVEFTSALAAKQDHLRYNLATQTGVLPDGLRPGDTWRFSAIVADKVLEEDDTLLAGAVAGADRGARFQALALQWAGAADSPAAQALAIASHMRRSGKYTDGEEGNEQYQPGHSIGRLATFLAADAQMAGNDEQYAATYALLLNQINVPTRVVMGAEVPSDGTVSGKDVKAWVEVQAVDGSWLRIDTETFMKKDTPPDQEQLTPQKSVPGKFIPPPNPVTPPSSVGESRADVDNNQVAHGAPDDEGFSLPGWVLGLLKYVALPVFVLLLLAGGIIGVKALRRRRRRTHGTPQRRLAQGWREVVDQGRDLGIRLTAGLTHREQATLIDADLVGPFARTTDAHVFGVVPPSDSSVEAYWRQVDEVRKGLTSGLPLRKRLGARLNVKSFGRLPRS